MMMGCSTCAQLLIQLALSAAAAQLVCSADVLAKEPSGLTCYFCDNVQNNYICNKFAIDTPCAAGMTFCRTLHIMDRDGATVVVDKRCVTSERCAQHTVGCIQEDRQKTCISCCDSSYCNEHVPTNYTSAVRSTSLTAPTRAMTSNAARGHIVTCTCALTALLVAMTTKLLTSSLSADFVCHQ